jgi:exopolysaccharide biosynthesis polyprenyl glycosylphosphotransferase
LDVAVVLLGAALAALVMGRDLDRAHLVVVAVAAAAFPLAVDRLQLNRLSVLQQDLVTWERLIRATLAGAAAILVATLFVHPSVSRRWALAFAVAAALGIVIERTLLHVLVRTLRHLGLLRRRVVMIGPEEDTHVLRDLLQADDELGYDVVAVADRHGDDPAGRSPEVVVDLAREADADAVVIPTSAMRPDEQARLVDELGLLGMPVEIISSAREVAPHRIVTRNLGSCPVVEIEPVTGRRWRSAAKRTFDVVLATLGLLITWPLLLLAAVAIKLDSAGPAFFVQSRVGRGGHRFSVYKLRTMVVDAEERLADVAHLNEGDGPLFKVRADPRLTRVGRFLRATSIDELPQLVNILKGDMSVVGPRPALPREVEQWDDRLLTRLRVKPGLTGMWQVSGRSDASFDDYQRLDLYYVRNWSLLTDLAIVLRTVPAVVARRGAR